MGWAQILQLAIPAGIEVVDYIISLIQKEARGEPITADDWKGLYILHATKSSRASLVEAVNKLPIPDA